MRLFIASLRKLVRRPATWLTFGLLAGLLALIMVAVATTAASGNLPSDEGQGGGDPLLLITFPGAYDQILAFLLGLGGLFAVLYGAAIAGSEWNWGTLKAAVARGESRVWYVLTAFAAIAVVMAGGLLFAFAVAVGAAALGATIAGVPLDGISDAATLGRLPEQMLRGWITIVEEGALGFRDRDPRAESAGGHRRRHRVLFRRGISRASSCPTSSNTGRSVSPVHPWARAAGSVVEAAAHRRSARCRRRRPSSWSSCGSSVRCSLPRS